MNVICLSVSKVEEKDVLNQIYLEAKPYFNRVEGRNPLPPLTINEAIPEIPQHCCHCLSIYYVEQLIGYLWCFEESPTNVYILHFYIKKNYRNLGFGKLALKELEKIYTTKNFQTAELLVSGSNYLGLKFWTVNGFTTIRQVSKPEEMQTSSVELELQKQLSTKKSTIHLLPIDEDNIRLGNHLTATLEQITQNLILSVPDAINAATEIPFAFPYFICLGNVVIGYTALVFDEEILEPQKRYWLWQLMIDENYQNKGYATEALKLIINYFKKQEVSVITLSTKPNNTTALHLYQKAGFKKTGETNDDEIILQKWLD